MRVYPNDPRQFQTGRRFIAKRKKIRKAEERTFLGMLGIMLMGAILLCAFV
jgi:hypothetical protein